MIVTRTRMRNTSRTRKIPPNVHIFGLTFAFFAVGMVLYMIAMVSGMWVIPGLIKEQTVRGPSGWTLTHLFVLGWATMIAMGASFQLTQVILRTSLYSRLLGYVHFFVYVIGLLVLTAGFYFGFSPGIALGGTLVVLGVILYVYNLTVTFVHKKEWNVYIFGVGFSLFNLLVTVGLGLLMGLSFAFGWMPFEYDNIFASHVWLGIVGWLASLIITYSFKLLPMFYNSPRRAVQEAYVILGLFQAGVWLQVVAQWKDWALLEMGSLLMILISLGIFVNFVRGVRAQSRRKHPGGAVSIAYMLIPLVCGFALLWTIVRLFFPNAIVFGPLAETLLIFLILGWFSASILSYLSKIVPFLWWAYRFHTKWERKSKVLLSDMTADKRMTNLLCAYLLGVVLVCAAFLFALPVLSLIGQITAVLSAVFYMLELLKVFRF